MELVIPGLDYPTGPYGRMPDGSYRTCHHCGTVERALKKWETSEIAGCECACHLYHEGKLTSQQKNWRRKKSGAKPGS